MNDPEELYTKEINHHVPSGFCTYATFTYREVEDPLRLYRGNNCVEVFSVTSWRKLKDPVICSLKIQWNF